MKKKTLMVVLAIAMLICLFTVAVSAAEPDTTKEKVTLSDGTVCPIWDTDGNALVWYIASTDEGGANVYGYVVADSESVDYRGNWSGAVYGATVYEVGAITVTVDGVSYGVDKIAVMNLTDDVKITSNKFIGEKVNCFSKTFTGSKSLEYIYLPEETVSFQSETFKSCSNLKYINFEDLTELRKMASQELNGCASLFANSVLDLSKTQLVEIGNLGFGNTNVTEVIFPNTVETIGNNIFEGCKSLVRADFPKSLKKINTSKAFNGCAKLETVTGLEGLLENGTIKSFGDYMFNGCSSLKNIEGLMDNGIMIFPEGFTSISPLTFTECDQIRYVEFSSTFNYLGQACFSFCDNLVLVSFDKVDAKIKAAIANGESYTKVTFNNCGTFKGCKSLVAMSVPEGTTDIINRFVAQGCSSLTAFYMPDSVTSLGTNGGGQGPFCNATKLYFVQESFTVSQCLVDGEIDLTRLNLPSKPSVYYMPKSLKTTHGHVQTNQWSKDGTLFLNCTSVNDVIVFGENYVDFNARNAFQGVGTTASPKTVVFLGDMTQFVTFKNAQHISFVFANKADKSPEDLNIIDMHYDQNNAESYMYFCFDGSRYDYRISQKDMANYADISAKVASVMATKTNDAKHVGKPELAVVISPADCLANAVMHNICFCGSDMGESEVEGTALGHNHTVDVGIYYENYMAEGYYSFKCERCEDLINGEAVEALFTDYGYSVTIAPIGGVYSMSQSYGINRYALETYIAQLDGSFEYGLVVSVSDNPMAKENEGLIADGKTFIAPHKFIAHDYFSVVVTGFSEVNLDKALTFCAYVLDGERVSYLDGGETVGKVTEKSYNDVKNIIGE